MGKHDAGFLRETSAAAFLDMKPSEFRQLVEKGALPPAGPLGRWDKEKLAAVMRGDPVKNVIQFEI